MLKAIVSDLNQIDEAHRTFYVEKDGKFLLNVTPTDGFSLENVDGLKNALGAERRKVSDLESSVRQFEGIDVTKAKKALADAEKYAAFDPDKEADRIAEQKFKSKEEQLLAEHEKVIRPLKESNDRLSAQVKKLLIDNAIKAELGKLNPLDDARDAIELLAAQSIRTKEVNGEFVAEVVDAQGNPRIKDVHGNPMSIADYLAEMREKRPSMFKADDKRGAGIQPGQSGATGASANNPWAKDTFNLTQQMVLLNTNPTLANKLKQEAGAK